MGRFGRDEGEPLQFAPTLGEMLPGVCGHWGVKIGAHDPAGNRAVPIISGPLFEDKKDAEVWLRDQQAYVWESADTGAEVIELAENNPYVRFEQDTSCYHLHAPSSKAPTPVIEL